MEEGRLYQVDTRLRPSGEQGLLVTSWGAFERYHRDEAAGLGAGRAAARARRYSERGRALGATRNDGALAAIALRSSGRRAAVRADLRRIRARVEKERGRVPKGSRHLRFDPGRHHGRRVSGRARPARARRRSGAAHDHHRGRARAPDRARLAAVAARTTTRRCAGRRCACGCCSTVPRTSCRRATCRFWPGAWGSPADSLGAELDERMGRVRAIFDERFGS